MRRGSIRRQLTNKKTKQFLRTLSLDIGIPISDLVKIKKGGDTRIQGTWVHPRVAVDLGYWLSGEFAVLLSGWAVDWMNQSIKPKEKTFIPRPEPLALKSAELFFPAAKKAVEKEHPMDCKEIQKYLDQDLKHEQFLETRHHSGWTWWQVREHFLKCLDILWEEQIIGEWNFLKIFDSEISLVRMLWVEIAEPEKVWSIFQDRFDPLYTWQDIEELVKAVGETLTAKDNFLKVQRTNGYKKIASICSLATIILNMNGFTKMP
jgi:hypothetical protein